MITGNGMGAAGYYEKNMQILSKSSTKSKQILSTSSTTEKSMYAMNKTNGIDKGKEQTALEKVKSSEDKLSAKAKSYLEKLRETYGEYDFIVADDGDDKSALLKQSNKEFAVIFSSEELEKMAQDENYAKEKLDALKTIVEMTKRINEQFSYERAWGQNGTGIIKKIAVSFNDDGSMSFFAELEKTSEKQKDYVEQIKEKRAEEKKKAQELAEKKAEAKEKESDAKIKATEVKKTMIEAASEEELIEKIQNIDWSKITGEELGVRFDFSV